MTFQERLKKAAEQAKVPWGQTAVAKSLGLKKQTVDRWFDKGEPKPAQLFLIADKWKVSVRWLATGDGSMLPSQPQSSPSDITAREEILLHLYRGLFTLQQARLVQGLRALFDANQITRKELGQKALRGVSDEEVERAFGKVPLGTRKGPKGGPRRQLGDAMGDFLDEV